MITTGCLIGLPVITVLGILVALTIPSFQQRAVQLAAQILSEKIGIEASVGHFSVRPPFDVLLKDVYAGDGHGDTLAFVGLLDARLRLDALPDSIAVKSLRASNLVAHSDTLIPAVTIDGRIGSLAAVLEPFNLSEGLFTIPDARISDADLSLLLNKKNTDAVSEGTNPVFDLKNILLENVRFSLEPIELKLDIGKTSASALIDIEESCYTVRSIDVQDTDFKIKTLEIPVGRFAGDAVVNLTDSFISSENLSINVPVWEAEAFLHDSSLDLDRMLVRSSGNGALAGSEFKLNAEYDIDDETFNAELVLGRTDLAKMFRMDGKELVVGGHIHAAGTGINPKDRKMAAKLAAGLDSCRFNGLDVSGLKLSATLKSGRIAGNVSAPVHYSDSSRSADLSLESRFEVSDFLGKYPGMVLNARLSDIVIPVNTSDSTIADNGDATRVFVNMPLEVRDLDIDFKTDEGVSDATVRMPGISLSANLPAHALDIPSLLPSFSGRINSLNGLDSLIAAVPDVNADLVVRKDNPFRGLLLSKGFDLTELSATLRSREDLKKLDVSLKTPDLDGKYRLPAMAAVLSANLSGSNAGAVLHFNSDIRDGMLSVRGIDTGIDLNSVLSRDGDFLKVDGDLKLADLVYDGKNIGERNVIFNLRPDSGDPNHFTANAFLDDIPIDLVRQFATLPEGIGIEGRVKSRAIVSGLPDKASLFAGVTPLDIAVNYSPYDVNLRLSEREITLKDNLISLNGLAVIGADSTSVNLNGGMDLGTKRLDVTLKSDGFEPVLLPKDGPIPVYGKLLAGIDGRISGPVDSLLADIGINVLPQTDITYPIDKKNLAQVSPSGKVNVGFSRDTGLRLGGRLNVTNGKLFYSPALYPMMPFSIDKGSHIKFNGSIEDTELTVSASQGAKAIYKPRGEVSRMVDFITGVNVGGSLKKLDIGFFLDAPHDKVIRKELSELSEEDREGLAAVLLATGMYASESNEAAQMEGYALTSIVQSKLNAASSNRLGNAVNLNFGVAKTKHGKGIETTDYTVNVSKSFFKGRLNVKLGGSVSDNAEVNRNSASFINNLSAEYNLDTAGIVRARVFSMKDYNNIVEGELIKSGTGILARKTLSHTRDSLDKSLDVELEGNVVLRSNNQLGPDAAISLTKQNIFNRNDIFSAKLKGAYYWNLNRRMLKDPARNDTYILGADFSLNFPYMQLGEWARKFNGQTLYRLGYLTENISGDYAVHKLYGGVDYSIRQNRYVTHSFSPLSLSIVLADRASEELAQTIGYEDLLKLFIENEFVPSVRYAFNYNNYSDKNRDVNTALDIQIKESANMISGILAATGKDFNERYKTFLGIDYDQFVKCRMELRNKFKLSDKLELATRAMAGAVISFGNSVASPLSEAFSIGGPNSIRAFMPRSFGPGDFHNKNYSSYIFHTGDLKLEMNAELRFPIVWKINGAVFVDAGNVWDLRNPEEYMTAEEIKAFMEGFNLTRMYNNSINAATFFNQIALGTGMGIRLDYESIVIRLDLGAAIHAPYDTGRSGYYNIPNLWQDGLRLNFGIGYPF